MRIEYIDFGLDDVCKLPERKRPIGDSGYDCYARVDTLVPAHGAARVPLGFGMKVPEGYMAYMHDRGGTYLRNLEAGNSLIDPNYRGEVHALMHNYTDEDIIIKRGERPCSLVVQPIIEINWKSSEEMEEINRLLNGEERGTNAFNSSGR